MFGVGKYKMRGGGYAEIVAVVNGIAIGFLDNDPTEVTTWIAKTGGFFIDKSVESRFDLIDPNAKKQIKVERWLTIYHDDSMGYFHAGAYKSLDAAKENKGRDCVAITKITIDCMEGDNLD